MKRFIALGFTAAALTLTGCTNNKACDGDCSDAGCEVCQAEQAATLSSASNESCPLAGGPVSANVETVSFQGKEIGFCCAGCATKFAAMSDSEKAAALASN